MGGRKIDQTRQLQSSSEEERESIVVDMENTGNNIKSRINNVNAEIVNVDEINQEIEGLGNVESDREKES